MSTRWGQGTDECCHGLMSVSQCSIQLASDLQAPQIRADRPMQVKQDPSPDVKSEHNVLCCSTQLDYTHTHTQTFSYSQLPVGRDGGIGRRLGIRAGRQSESPPPQCLSGDKSWPAHSARTKTGRIKRGSVPLWNT